MAAIVYKSMAHDEPASIGAGSQLAIDCHCLTSVNNYRDLGGFYGVYFVLNNGEHLPYPEDCELNLRPANQLGAMYFLFFYVAPQH